MLKEQFTQKKIKLCHHLLTPILIKKSWVMPTKYFWTFENLITPEELCGTILIFCVFFPIFHALKTMAVKIQKYSVNHKTSADFPSAWESVDKDYIFIFG